MRYVLFFFGVFLWLVPFPVFGETAWETFQGPVVRVEAVIRPYVNVSVSLADDEGKALVGQEPVVFFDCAQGPGTYRAKNPLLLSVVTNTPLQVFFEATPLEGGKEKESLPPERLSIAFFSKGKEPEKFLRFAKGQKLLLFETPTGGVVYSALCALQLDVTHEDRAGTYEGCIIVEALYRP